MVDIKKFLKGKRGNILVSDVIFLVLALVFISILLGFIVRERSNVKTLEEQSAKELALMIDAMPVGMQATIPLQVLLAKKDVNYVGDVVVIDGAQHFVRVQLSEKSGFSYGYFNGADVHGAMRGEQLEVSVE